MMMLSSRKSCLLLAVGCGLGWVPGALAETEIAVLNVARVFEQYEMTKDLEALFDQARREAADEAERRRSSMEQMRKALSAFDPDSDDFARREDELSRAEIEFQVWSKSTERRLKDNHLRWMRRIYHNTQATIAQIAGERSIDLVLTYDELTDDAPDSVALRQQILLQKVIYHSDRLDITDETLRRLNEAYRKSGGIQSLELAVEGGANPAPASQNPGQP